MNIEKLAIESGVIHVNDNSIYWTENNAIEVLVRFAQAVLRADKIRKYKIVIEVPKKCHVYEIEAENEADAEEIAWSQYKNNDFSEPFVARTVEIQ